MLKKKIQERRKYPRLPAYHLVKYKVISTAEEAKTVVSSLSDIGEGGICLRSEEELPVGSVVQLSINFPQLPQPVTSLAKVMWAKKLKNAKMYESGLQFIEIEDMVRREIANRVETLHRIAGGKKK